MTATDINTTMLPTPGDIHRAWITWHYADGSWYQEGRDVLILDVTVVDDGARVIWRLMEGYGSEYLPVGPDHIDTFPRAEWPAGTIQWDRIPSATYVVSLGAPVRTYKPRDPAGNGIDVLREYALRRLENPSPLAEDLRTAVREISARIDQLPAIRDQLIRDALAHRIRVEDLAQDAGLSAARIYQIRDGRR